MEEALQLFLVAPKGYEEMTSVIVAPTEREARDKVSLKPPIKELLDQGVELTSVNITAGMAMQGCNVDVSKAGMFH